MKHPWKRIFVPILLLFFSLLIDGTITGLFHQQLTTGSGYMIPRVFLVVFLMCAFYLPPKQLISLSLIFGLIYDSYYSGILGIYAAYINIMVYILSKVRNTFFPNMLIIGMLGIVAISTIEASVFLTYSVLGVTQLSGLQFAAERLGPTLILNGLFFIVLYYPLKTLLFYIFEEDK